MLRLGARDIISLVPGVVEPVGEGVPELAVHRASALDHVAKPPDHPEHWHLFQLHRPARGPVRLPERRGVLSRTPNPVPGKQDANGGTFFALRNQSHVQYCGQTMAAHADAVCYAHVA